MQYLCRSRGLSGCISMGWGKRAGGNHQPSVFLISPRWRLMSIVPQCLCSVRVTAMSSSSLATPPSRPESQLFHSGTWNIFGSAPELRRHAGELSDCLGSSPPAFAFPVVCTEPRADDRTRPYLSPGQQQEAGHGVPDADMRGSPQFLIVSLCSENSVRRVRAKGTENASAW